MIDVARTWLAANPDPKDPFLRAPRDEWEDRVRVRDRTDFARWETQVAQLPDAIKPEVRRDIDKVRALSREIEAEEQSLDKLREDLAKSLNMTPTPGQAKVDSSRYLIGRWCLAWARYGYNVFEISADFTAAMLLTDARELDIEE